MALALALLLVLVEVEVEVQVQVQGWAVLVGSRSICDIPVMSRKSSESIVLLFD